MSSSDNHTIRNGLITTIVGGIILLFIQALSPGFATLLLGWVNSTWSFVTSDFQIPRWVFGILLIISTLAVLRPVSAFIRGFVSDESSLSTYKEDCIFGVIWRWDTMMGRQPAFPMPFCPNCQSRLTATPSITHQNTTLYCPHCNLDLHKFDCDLDYALDEVRIEVERRITTGEWKQALPQTTSEKQDGRGKG